MAFKGSLRFSVATASVAFALAIGVASPAFSMGNASNWSGSGADLSDVKSLVDDGKYDQAITKLTGILKDDPQDADALNYLAYSQRKSGDLSSAEQNYERALLIDPEHKGALEYQGELFIMTDRIDMARENLARLNQICGTDCDEYKELASKLPQ